ncbi:MULTISPECIES: aspartate kinase [Priestia]|jgi:aspartate kinase|uniref:Aspartokinase n=3 Tax=Priestia TaxID=2800373 RepID=D5DQ49_PRIM1|nr:MULTISPECIES: aspartate kinase [Priestia]AVX10031.1 aspartate kinase [Bacillus sp. Y-01]KOP76127.1 aspartate kinase [Bacillus sp. FJAT-21351]KQU22956.1 aspartate kinase [Bacillus sp. Leaf75]KRF57426.1 aspartate kinase [Bacillus sp. Soil531]MBZ5478362.1 aspartate kinase [Bacillus sp. T_4]MCF6798016.1 aspartate kinase [Bacillus sp. ET1]MDH6652847.1 aspartate kinase [Bacillus sp. PvP124]MDP9577052.1 aspartate kinase [Bacillus sp. 1751]RFB25750.1 aspartate kinase [Bacillus sp. ALD]RFB36972
MKIIVQKFGGTSVRNEEGRARAIYHLNNALSEGYKVVVVVSAMGRKGEPYATDTLLSLVDGNKASLNKRELDMLMACGELISSVVFTNLLNENGIKATALNGAQAGFVTNDDFTNAKILEMKCDRLLKELEEYDVVVVTGFQGATTEGDTTTLGRGGSDTSASALGAALMADYIDIFTDVEGVMTADPRIVEDARPLSVVTYNEICNMAYQGAKVVHPRAVEIAMQAKVPMRVRSTYADSAGTLVTSQGEAQQRGSDVQERLVTGIAHVSNVTQIKVFSKEGHYDTQAEVFKAMAQEKISVDFINISPKGVVYTVTDEATDKAIDVLHALGYEPAVIRNCAKVSTVGAGIAGVPGVTSKIVTALSSEGIQILQSADSHTTIWVLVKEEDLKKAVNALHGAFDLSKAPQKR